MKLAFSTNAYTRFTLGEALRDIRAAGFEGVEILADVPHAWPGEMDERMAGEARGEVERLGLVVSNVNCNCSFGYWKDAPGEPYFEPSLISPNVKHREDRGRLILAAMGFAKGVGARNISITSGRLLGGMPPERAAGVFAEGMKPILERAEKLGVDVGIECEPGLYVEYVAELVGWIEKLGSKRLGANLDVGHSVVIGESVSEVVRMLKGRIWNLHVEDLPGRKHYHMIPGEGTFGWGELKGVLTEVGYERFATVELYTQTADPQGAARKSYAFLRRWARGEGGDAGRTRGG